MKIRSTLLTLLALVLAGTAQAQPARPSGAIVTGHVAAVAGDTGGVELETSSSGNGIILHMVTVDAGDSYGVTITDTTFLDTSIVVLTPSFKFGQATLTTIARKGIDGTGSVPVDGAFFVNGTNASAGAGFIGAFPVFVPPGKFISVRRAAVNVAVSVTIGFTEIQ